MISLEDKCMHGAIWAGMFYEDPEDDDRTINVVLTWLSVHV